MSDSTQSFAPLSRLALIRNVTQDVLSQMSEDDLKDHTYVESVILEQVYQQIAMENSVRTGNKWKHITELLPAQIAHILAVSHPVVRIASAGLHVDEEQDLLAMYCSDGEFAGTYVSSEVEFRKLIREYNYTITTRGVEETMSVLRELVPRVVPCRERNLIAVNNGIFDYDTKELRPFSPDIVFLTKSKVNYNPMAVNPVIHNDEDNTDWDVESWMHDLSDDDEVVNVLWQILGAIIRPLVSWNKSAWFYSETGNNGKGTLCELMRQLCGEGSYASIPLSDFSKDFMLEPLTRATSIIVDENDVGTFIDKAANLKAVITGDTILINRKFKIPMAFQFKGFMVQCLNEMPRIKDKSDSFYRRQMFIPFTKCFTGKERKYIKHDYLHRQDVLEYVMYKVLHMNYYELSVPAVCIEALNEYKTFSDPVRQFVTEIMPKVKWDLLPCMFLYDLYKCWYKQNFGERASEYGKNRFLKDVKTLIPELYPGWAFSDNRAIHSKGRMDCPEPLIGEYHLPECYMQPKLTQHADPMARYFPMHISSSYRGFYRLVPQKGSDEEVAAGLVNQDDDV